MLLGKTLQRRTPAETLAPAVCARVWSGGLVKMWLQGQEVLWINSRLRGKLGKATRHIHFWGSEATENWV